MSNFSNFHTAQSALNNAHALIAKARKVGHPTGPKDEVINLKLSDLRRIIELVADETELEGRISQIRKSI